MCKAQIIFVVTSLDSWKEFQYVRIIKKNFHHELDCWVILWLIGCFSLGSLKSLFHRCQRDLPCLMHNKSLKMVFTKPFEMPITVSTRSLMVNQQFSSRKSLIWFTCCASFDVVGHPRRCSFSMLPLPLKSYYPITKAFCNILNFYNARIFIP